jgi:hypothetical protein
MENQCFHRAQAIEWRIIVLFVSINQIAPITDRQHKTKTKPAVGMHGFGHDYGGWYFGQVTGDL